MREILAKFKSDLESVLKAEPEDIDRVMNRSDLRPAGVDWKFLYASRLSLSIPGFPQAVRVDDHFQSYEFLSPGNQICEQLTQELANQSGESETDKDPPVPKSY